MYFAWRLPVALMNTNALKKFAPAARARLMDVVRVKLDLSRFMQSLEGDLSQYYNRRKRRQNAFWGDRYHGTMIESGELGKHPVPGGHCSTNYLASSSFAPHG